METENGKLYYVGVQFDNSRVTYSYICDDLTVKAGDRVIVPVSENQEIKATVITARLYSLNEVPYPFEKTKRVIRKVEEASEQAVIADPVPKKQADEEQEDRSHEKQADSAVQAKKKANSRKKKELITNIIAVILATPIYTLIFGFIIALIMLVMGWRIVEGLWWIPFLIAFPIAVGAGIYHCSRTPTKAISRGTYYKNSKSSDDAGGGWYPGCPEDEVLSSTDSLFDFNGDGHLDEFESSTRYDSFFGDDE